ncbi:MAG: pyruvate dehydrogenase (acetyl-transferring), homodimeric type [Candidatus Hydrogenedentes bacterium]|nr:pyruvate dehydrogenase (acetyl-transferring), homodimeric type [Candidatus Hydrogenedentota bacterium]
MSSEARLIDDPDGVLEDEVREWIQSFNYILEHQGDDHAIALFERLKTHAEARGVKFPFTGNTPYVNTIAPEDQPQYPGNREIERRIKSIIRWNAMAMVVRANREEVGIGGHISTFASAATLYEVGFNHFFRGTGKDHSGDQIYFQGHAAPGIYSRAFLEGRLSNEQLENFRAELHPNGGLSSYPHPWLMPEFWQFPTVSMGLGPLMAIYQARFNRYLEDRGMKKDTGNKVWAFLGDGETDEPESLGAITLAAREKLDNLIFVINCNLQRLDGPVRGNGKIIQELETLFRGAGWNVIKVIWGGDWDPLLERDKDGWLATRMGEIVDGQYQKYTVESGKYIREHFFKNDPKLMALARTMSDEQLRKLKRGGHDPEKVFAAYQAAITHKGQPTVILAKTIKGYGLGESGEGKNITHQQKKLNEDELREFRTRFGIPISDEDVAHAPFYRPADDSPEIKYLKERRESLGGFMPTRATKCAPLKTPDNAWFEEFYKGSEDRAFSTTMAFVRILSKLLRHKEIGKYVVPIVPDEARTFGMEALFRQIGIYSHVGQLYEPVDSDTLIYYKEAKDGQILEEGITEAGSMSSFIAAGTAYSTHGIPTIPFFIYYSMFGLQRIGDLIWLAGDIRCRGFLLGATAGRTTLAGEGLQHQDGHSHVLALPIPNLIAYDPTFAYELAVIIRDGIRRMYEEQESVFYYITVGNENYPMLGMPEGSEQGILRGMYKLRASTQKKLKLKATLLGSGSILNEALKAQELLAEKFGVAADVWSVTSYKELRKDIVDTARWNMLNPGEKPRESYVEQCLKNEAGPIVAASDYLKILPDSLSQAIPQRLVSLGTNGYGRSESRKALRDFFEVDARWIAYATLHGLYLDGKIKEDVVKQAMQTLEIDPNKLNPANS